MRPQRRYSYSDSDSDSGDDDLFRPGMRARAFEAGYQPPRGGRRPAEEPPYDQTNYPPRPSFPRGVRPQPPREEYPPQPRREPEPPRGTEYGIPRRHESPFDDDDFLDDFGNLSMGDDGPRSSNMGGGFPGRSPMGGGFPGRSPMGGGFPGRSPMGGGFPGRSSMGGGFPGRSSMGGDFPGGFPGGFPGRSFMGGGAGPRGMGGGPRSGDPSGRSSMGGGFDPRMGMGGGFGPMGGENFSGFRPMPGGGEYFERRSTPGGGYSEYRSTRQSAGGNGFDDFPGGYGSRRGGGPGMGGGSPRPGMDSRRGTSRPTYEPREDVLDLYATLGVAFNATQEQIRTAYHKLSMKHHPDRVRDQAKKAAATVKMAEINRANDVLKDEEKRAHYDRTGQIYSGDLNG